MQDKTTKNPHQIKFRISDPELEKAQKETKILGTTVTEFAKITFLNRVPITVLLSNEEAKAIMLQLQRIGTNLNQIARHLNSGIREGFHRELNELTEQVNTIRQFISGVYGSRRS